LVLQLLCASQGNKEQEENILTLSRELEILKIEIRLLKRELNLVDNCPDEFRTVPTSEGN
jgi:hypothetical protein